MSSRILRRRTRQLTPAERRALAAYRRTHGGLEGNAKVTPLRAADPRVPLAALGLLLEATYVTVKDGDDGPTAYEHKFRPPYPVLAFAPKSGLLAVCGGGYRVTERGIVG